ncbi:hypothetical protein EYB25_002449 [Talaromyces marneffei]|nr:hypothetical protein EYB25_002449 [Talaromyces marneffei]
MWSPTKLLVLIMFFGSVAHACDCVTDCTDCPKGTICEHNPVWCTIIGCADPHFINHCNDGAVTERSIVLFLQERG